MAGVNDAGWLTAADRAAFDKAMDNVLDRYLAP